MLLDLVVTAMMVGEKPSKCGRKRHLPQLDAYKNEAPSTKMLCARREETRVTDRLAVA